MTLKIGDLIPVGAVGNVKANEVLQGKTYSSLDGINLNGTMKNYGDKTIVPNEAPQILSSGFYNSIKIDSIDKNILDSLSVLEYRKAFLNCPSTFTDFYDNKIYCFDFDKKSGQIIDFNTFKTIKTITECLGLNRFGYINYQTHNSMKPYGDLISYKDNTVIRKMPLDQWKNAEYSMRDNISFGCILCDKDYKFHCYDCGSRYSTPRWYRNEYHKGSEGGEYGNLMYTTKSGKVILQSKLIHCSLDIYKTQE